MKTSRLFVGTLISLIAFSSLGIASSIAWYQNATHLEVNTLDISFAGNKELLLSTTGEEGTYKEKLTYEDLNYVSRFMPVSSMFSSKWMNEENPLPKFYEYTGLTRVDTDGNPSDPQPCTAGFFSQTLYVQSDENVYVGLDPTNCFVRAYEAANEETASKIHESGYTHEELVQRLNSLEKAMRFSIYDIEEKTYYIIDPHKEGTTYLGGILDIGGSGNYDTYTDAEGNVKDIVYGEVNDRSKVIYGEPLAADANVEGELTAFNSGRNKHTYPYDEEASFANGLEIAEEPSLPLTASMGSNDLENNPIVIPFQAYTPKPIRMSLYLEGWDHDCVNANMGGSFLAQIQFKILREKTL